MNEESKKIEQAEQKPNADNKPQVELAAEDLEQVAGGVAVPETPVLVAVKTVSW